MKMYLVSMCLDEANKIKSDLTSYARENGDNTTEFIIEEL